MTVLLLAIWLPATGHCLLDAADLLRADCCQAETADTTSHCADECRLIEAGIFKLQERQAPAFVPAVFLISLSSPAEVEPSMIPPDERHWPPAALHLPEFLVRTSLPVRGPSFSV